ncbi:hypothetical protein KIN20_023663 [Parelaphostrongylus tenuis]|uniref:Protein kinase domain-containing protein n=1 Tax=Parelaphostrongylus tenuis TaxID=148309 RepID=A0AAD5MXA1_PARTN|nr:hypothetical protein KIN20_023663 [Parelaphostrongylus tenuis]
MAILWSSNKLRFSSSQNDSDLQMCAPLGPVKLNIGDKVKDQFLVKKKLGEGACGQVFLVHMIDKNGKALQDLHEAGFVHRDVKPSNLAMGLYNTQVVYVFDFGLARQILVPDEGGRLKLREPRNKVMFRGTVRYCSLNVHQYREQGRHDDLYGVLFSMIECLTANLPWKGLARKEAAKVKDNTNDVTLCRGCPSSFLEMAKTLRKLTYHDVPPYKKFMEILRQDLPPKMKMTDPYEWDKPGEKQPEQEGERIKSDRAEADKDANNDKNTVNEVDESVVTEEKGSSLSVGDETDKFAKEDTLEGL